jgi:hypothetical protein
MVCVNFAKHTDMQHDTTCLVHVADKGIKNKIEKQMASNETNKSRKIHKLNIALLNILTYMIQNDTFV